MPVITCPSDLVGRRVCRLFTDGKDGEQWYLGTIFSGGSGKNPIFSIRYDIEKNKIYKYWLMEDYNNGDLAPVQLCVDDLIGKDILQLWTDEISNKDTWWRAEVIDNDEDSEDMENPDFFVSYCDDDDNDDDDDGGGDDDNQFYLCSLFEDYANGWIRLC